MAKRVKLADVLGESKCKVDEVKAENLTLSHESERLVELAERLKKLAHQPNLSSYERDRSYEQLLEEFRRIQELVLRQGVHKQPLKSITPSTLSEERLRQAIREEITTLLRDNNRSETYPSVMEDKDAKLPIHTVAKSKRQSVTRITSTRGQNKPPTSPKSGATGSDQTASRDLQAYITNLLLKSGFKITNQTVQPPKSYGDKDPNIILFKPRQGGYSIGTYQKVFRYLFDRNPGTTSRKHGGSMDTISYHILKGIKKATSKSELNRLMKRYPNIASTDSYFHSMHFK